MKTLLLAAFARAFCAANGFVNCDAGDAYAYTLSRPTEYVGIATRVRVYDVAPCSDLGLGFLDFVYWGTYSYNDEYQFGQFDVYICRFPKEGPTS